MHHNTDKTALLGGHAEVSFGSGRIVEPIHILVNGRLTRSLGGQEVPVDERELRVEVPETCQTLTAGAARALLRILLKCHEELTKRQQEERTTE
ncbi:hypothetical protein GCM10009560_14100 [Nonomuraea longicatena]|uniref:Uncharacterized protein n=1 Tax=Nonomuraea longicatena TaxID=83682 RepID=A0ABN1NVI6_9ACTN